MADEQLRMQATVVDGFTGPLRALNNLLGQIGANPAAKQVTKDWQGVSASLNRVTTDIRTGLQPALAGIGVASLGIGGAIGSAAMALKNFAFNTRELNLFSRQIGLSVDQLRQLKAVGERFGMDWNSAQGSLKAFAGNMDQLQRRWGEAYGKLRSMNLGELAEGLVSAPNMQTAIDKALDGLKSIQNPVRRREVAQLLFGSDQWATVAAELTPALRAEIRKLTAAIGPDTQKAADEFVSNWQRMQQSVDAFVVQGLGPALKPLNELIDLLNKPVGSALTDMMERLTKAAKYLGEGEWLKGFRVLDGGNGSLARRFAPLPGDDVLNGQDRAEALRRQIENADRQIGLTEGRGGDTRSMRARRDDLAEQLRKLTEELKAMRGGATVQQQSFGSDGSGGVAGLIQRAAFGGYGGGGGGNPFGAGFWSGVYRSGVGGDPFRGGGRTWDRSDGGKGDGGSSASGDGAARRGGAIEGGAPTGDGRGTRGAAHRADMMGWAMDQLRREGVPEANLKAAAAHLVGQAQMESGLDPNKTHDGGTGYGIYGARDPKGWGDPNGRRTKMVQWLEANGYARNSAEGQMRYMSREAMSGRYRLTRQALMTASPETFDRDTPVITREFESPAVVNHRTGAVRQAFGTQPRVPSVSAISADRRAEGPRNVAGWGSDREMQEATGVRRSGDSMMARSFGPSGVSAGAPKLDASGTVTINLTGGLEKAPARVSSDGLFKDVQVNRKPKMAIADTGDGSP